MKTTLSVIKADVGSIGGHIKPSTRLKQAVEQHVREKGKKLLIDLYVSSTGDDVALLMAHDRGPDDSKIHELAWDAFMAGTKVDVADDCEILSCVEVRAEEVSRLLEQPSRPYLVRLGED